MYRKRKQKPRKSTCTPYQVIYKVNICIWLLFRLLLFANGGLGSDGGEGRRDVVSKTCAIFLVWGRIGVLRGDNTEVHFLAIHRALEKLGLRTKVTGLF